MNLYVLGFNPKNSGYSMLYKASKPSDWSLYPQIENII